MIEKLRFYVRNTAERQRIAGNGYMLAHSKYNTERVTRYIIESTLGIPFTHEYAWPTERHFPA